MSGRIDLRPLLQDASGEVKITCRKGARLTLSWGPLLRATRRDALTAIRTGQDVGWVAVELRVHNRRPAELAIYAEGPHAARRGNLTLYANVPTAKVEDLIHRYGGIARCTTNP